MDDLRLDAPRIRRLCSELNITLRDIGHTLATNGNTVLRLLEGRGDIGSVTLGDLSRLAGLLGVEPVSLLAQADNGHLKPSHDDAVVECALARLGVGVTRTQLATGLGWDLHRVRRAVTSLEKRLAGTGVTLHRRGTATVSVRARDELLSDDQRRRIDTTELRRRGLTLTTAQLLLRVAQRQRLNVVTLAHARFRMERSSLLRVGLVQEDLAGNLRLHPDVTFSLGLADA